MTKLLTKFVTVPFRSDVAQEIRLYYSDFVPADLACSMLIYKPRETLQNETFTPLPNRRRHTLRVSHHDAVVPAVPENRHRLGDPRGRALSRPPSGVDRHGRVTIDEVPASFAPYFSDVIGVMFVLWMVRMLLSMALMTNPQGLLITLIAQLFIFVFFNAVPELIYLGHHSSLELLGESYQFIADNWIEWFPPTLVAGAIFVVLMELPLAGALVVVKWALVGLFVYFVMVLRGFLFEELQGSTRRSRAFRYRSR